MHGRKQAKFPSFVLFTGQYSAKATHAEQYVYASPMLRSILLYSVVFCSVAKDSDMHNKTGTLLQPVNQKIIRYSPHFEELVESFQPSFENDIRA